MKVGIRHLLAAVAAILVLPATALAANDSVATTNPATNVTPISAQLNGTSNAAAGSNYFFEWGSTTCHDHMTQTTNVPTGTQHVSANIGNLAPGVTYCFHLVVQNGGYMTDRHIGTDVMFTTSTAVATTGDATSVTASSAILNGVANTTNSDSQWMFQYGTSTSYGTVTQPHPIGAGVTVVSIKLTGLKPGTTYHYRLVVVQGSYPSVQSTGSDRTFTTPRGTTFGKLSLRKHRLRVSHRHVRIPLRCQGPPGGVCRGTLRITVGKRACAGGHFSLRTGQRKTVRKTVRGRCLARLAGHRRLRARFRAILAGPQGQLKARVRLVE